MMVPSPPPPSLMSHRRYTTVLSYASTLAGFLDNCFISPSYSLGQTQKRLQKHPDQQRTKLGNGRGGLAPPLAPSHHPGQGKYFISFFVFISYFHSFIFLFFSLGWCQAPSPSVMNHTAFGPTFPSWSVLDAKSDPEAENERISTFCSQKWEVAFLRLWSKKGAQNVAFIKGLALLAKVSENHFLFLT